MSYYREQLESELKSIDVKGDYVADIGGLAWPVNTRVKSWHVNHYMIFDNAYDKNDIYFLDLNKVQEKNQASSTIFKNKFDQVFCLEVMEYIYNPLVALDNLNLLLKPAGELMITFPSIYPVHEPIEYDYLRYTKSAITKILEITNFKVLKIKPRNPRPEGMQLLDSFYRLDGMHPAKHTYDIYHTGYIVYAKKNG